MDEHRARDAAGVAPGDGGTQRQPAHVGGQHRGDREFAGAEDQGELARSGACKIRLVRDCTLLHGSGLSFQCANNTLTGLTWLPHEPDAPELVEVMLKI